jgi:hypothetical protein
MPPDEPKYFKKTSEKNTDILRKLSENIQDKSDNFNVICNL